MSEYVTFIGKDQDGNILDRVVVTLYDAAGARVLNDEFGPGVPGQQMTAVALPVTVYRAWVRSPGYQFPWLAPISVNVGDGASISTARVIEFTGTRTVPPALEVPVRVFGWVSLPSPNATPGRKRLAGGTSFDDGPSRSAATVAHQISFRRVGPPKDGEVRALTTKGRFRVGSDPNGYFEAALEPETVYEVSIPGVSGTRFIQTPTAGSEAELESLIDASRSVFPYDLV